MHSIFYAKNVSKQFDKFKLDNISFEVPGGSIVGVIGKNGCGKSTLLSALMGMIKSDFADTEIAIDGVRLRADEKAYKKKIAYVFNELPFRDNLSAVSIGKYYGRYYDGFDQKKYEALLKQYGLIDFPGFPLRVSKSKKDIMNVSDFSQGQKIRLQLAFAQSYDAQVYFFDEPTGNLDVEFRDEFYDTVREISSDENKCVIYATHLVEELEHFADYILWIEKKDNTGSEFYYGSLDDLKDSYRIVSGEKTMLERIPKELVVGGRLSENSNEILIRYDETKIDHGIGYDETKIDNGIGYDKTRIDHGTRCDETKLDHKIRQHMRYADLKEIMYYEEKAGVISNDKGLF